MKLRVRAGQVPLQRLQSREWAGCEMGGLLSLLQDQQMFLFRADLALGVGGVEPGGERKEGRKEELSPCFNFSTWFCTQVKMSGLEYSAISVVYSLGQTI